MSIKSGLLLAALLAPLGAALAAYVGLVQDGAIPPPDWAALGRVLNVGTTTAVTLALVICLAVVGLLALFAPVIYAIRANDPLTVIITLVMTVATIALFAQSRTVMDQISALIVFLANVTLSGVVYAAHRIAPR